MPKFRRKPIVVEAFMWPCETPPDWWKAALDQPAFTVGAAREDVSDGFAAFAIIATREGIHRVLVRDYIIRGIRGELYPCKPDIFAETYDAVHGGVVDGPS